MKRLAAKILAGLTLMLAACESELPLEGISATPRLVVNALINDKDLIEVQVSSSIALNSKNPIKFLENADVTVSDENGNSFTLTYDLGKQVYVSNFIPQAGKYYRINVKATGFREVDAELIMPDKAVTTPATWLDNTGTDSSGFPTGTITLKINDRGDSRNYYRISLFYYDDLVTEFKTLRPELTDAAITNEMIRNDDGSIVFEDRLFNGEQRSLDFITPFGYGTGNPRFLVVTENLSRDYYNYFISLDKYRQSGSVFNEPTPVFSNIRNGIGIWAGSTLSRDTIR